MNAITQTTGGKIAIGVILVLALAGVIYQVMHMSDGEKSRDVSANDVVSQAQQQIDAINKMTNISPQLKQQMIAREQGEIDTAKKSMNPGAASSSASTSHPGGGT